MAYLVHTKWFWTGPNGHANIKTERKLAQTNDHAFAFNKTLKFQKICTNPQTGINFDAIVPESVYGN